MIIFYLPAKITRLKKIQHKMDFKKYQTDIRRLLVVSEKRKSKNTTKKKTYTYQYQKGVCVFSKESNSDNHKIGRLEVEDYLID